jgi:hypothetical protein
MCGHSVIRGDNHDLFVFRPDLLDRSGAIFPVPEDAG